MTKRYILRKQDGLTLVELLVTMVIFVLIMSAASSVFTGLLTQFKQQSRIAESNVEGIVGLEIMRQDIEHAGYGLPWNWQAASIVTYTEAGSTPASTYNDIGTGSPPRGSTSGTCNPPTAIISGNDVNTVVPDSPTDYLVIKAVNVAGNDASAKWTNLRKASPYVTTWDPESENLDKEKGVSTDPHVIVIDPGTTDANARTLIVNASNSFNSAFSGVTSSPWLPLDDNTTWVVYGINGSADPTPVRPFNRVDYFIQRPGMGMPTRCAPKTGILYKAVMLHNSTGTFNMLPLLDCVADMQIVFGMDNDESGDFVPGQGTPPDGYSEDITNLTTQQIRNRVKEVRVYILAHEGQRDPNYTYSSSTISLGGDVGLGRTFDLTKIGDPDYKFYRWKVYTLVVKPFDLR